MTNFSQSGPPPMILTAKLSMPRLSDNLVIRRSLLKRLNDGLRRGDGLFLLSAPAGYGKTTLICQWLNNQPFHKLWLSLDEKDNDPFRFLSCLAAAFQRVLPETVFITSSLFEATQLPPVDSLIVPLINCLTDLDERLLLVFDDYHLIQNFYIHNIVQFILDYRPSLLHLVLITREDPPLKLALVRTGEAITEIRISDLRFSESESFAFLTGPMKLNLEKEAVALLVILTEGWVAALQLAALSLQGRPPREIIDFIVDFSENHRNILDYLIFAFLASQSKEIRDFLHQTVSFDYLCAPLCNAVTGSDNSQVTLESLENNHVFLFSLDEQRQWYRYHRLFADLLGAGLTQLERQSIQQKAACWYEANGHLKEAFAQASSDNPDIHYFTGLVDPLSNRELEVLQLVTAGFSNEEIARTLVISLNTTKWHLKNIFSKLGVKNRLQAVIKAKELNLA